MLQRHVARDHLDDLGVHLEPREIHRRHAVLPRQHLGDLGFLDEAELHQVVADPGAVGLLFLKRLVELLLGDQAFTNEEVADPITGGGRGCRHMRGPFY